MAPEGLSFITLSLKPNYASKFKHKRTIVAGAIQFDTCLIAVGSSFYPILFFCKYILTLSFSFLGHRRCILANKQTYFKVVGM
jgi:hypothetical protein